MTTYLGTASGSTPGVQGDSATSSANGVKGTSSAGSSAVYGYNNGGGAAVHGESSSSSAWGVYGYSSGASGYGVYASGATGLYAVTTNSGNAGYFNGAVYVSGSLTKAGGGFLIDHPLDPGNRICEHSFVESPDRKNVYDGTATADANGEAIVQLPAYFEALNKDVRYQLTPIGSAAPDLHVKAPLRNNQFVVAGAKAGQQICWQVTGTRKDAWAEANPLVAERDKPADQRGRYLNPEVHGQPADKQIHPPAPPPNGIATSGP